MEGDEIKAAVDREFACEHQGTEELRRFTAANGTHHYRIQCTRCGALVRSVKKESVPLHRLRELPPYDGDLAGRWSVAKWGRYRELADGARGEKLQAMRVDYAQYRETPEWRELRRRVLDRANRVCEGCGQAEATQAHHLTYERLGREMLFDLVAVCRACHEAIHGIEDEDGEPEPAPSAVDDAFAAFARWEVRAVDN